MLKGTFWWSLVLLCLLFGCASGPVVSYQRDIDPILQKKCQRCHSPPNGMGFVQTGLNMRTYDTLMQGTVFGDVVIPGDSKRSVLNKLVEGRAGELMRMPHGDAKRLTQHEINEMKWWVEQGALNN